jgi:hypothetical protein
MFIKEMDELQFFNAKWRSNKSKSGEPKYHTGPRSMQPYTTECSLAQRDDHHPKLSSLISSVVY